MQQAVEKSLKAVLIFEEKAVPLTHSLELLVSELAESDQKKFPEAINELTLFATVKRYTEGDEIIEKKDIEALGKEITNLLVLASEEAMLRPALLGLAFTPTTFQFHIYQEDKTRSSTWKPIAKPPLNLHSFSIALSDIIFYM